MEVGAENHIVQARKPYHLIREWCTEDASNCTEDPACTLDVLLASELRGRYALLRFTEHTRHSSVLCCSTKHIIWLYIHVCKQQQYALIACITRHSKVLTQSNINLGSGWTTLLALNNFPRWI